MTELASVARGGAGAAGLTAGVFNIMRFATHDGPGIRTTVFFKGCPLSCWWCHNPEGQSFRTQVLYFEERCRHCGDCLAACPEGVVEFGCRRCGVCADACQAEARQVAGKRTTLAEVLREIEKDAIFYDESGGGVTLSGGEPVAQSRFAEALLRACRDRGIHTVLETCGFAHPETFMRVALAADQVLFDLKLMDPVRHKQYTGVSNRRILHNLEQLAARRSALRVRIPVVPGINDSDEDAGQFREYLKRLAIRDIELLPYHRIGSEKYRRLGLAYRIPDTPEPVAAEMTRMTRAIVGGGK